MAKILRFALLAMLLGGGVALWAGLTPALSNVGQSNSLPLSPFRAQAALACGLGAAPTMTANNVAALAYPSNGNYVLESILGEFVFDYPVNQPITFAENFSRVPFAPSPSSFLWQWNFGDGSALGTSATVTHTYTQTGTYTIQSFTDQPNDPTNQYALFDNAQIHIVAATIPNPPVAKAKALTPTEILANQSITFDASGSHAVVGSQLTYTWNFGDNTSATGIRVTHQFVATGVGVATLIVTDARGAKSTASVNIAVGGPGATIHASATSAHSGANVSFTAAEPALPNGPQGAAKLLKVTWDFDDGTTPLTTQTPSASHAFAKVGSYHVTVQFVNTDSSVLVAALTVSVTAAPVVKATSGSGGSHWWLLIGGAMALLAVIAVAIYLWLAQQRRQQLALAKQRARGRPAGARRNPQGQGQYGRPNPRMGGMGAQRGNTAMRQGVPTPAARRLAPDMPPRSSSGQQGQSGQYGRRGPISGASGAYPTRGQGAQPGATGRQSMPRRPGMPGAQGAPNSGNSGMRPSPANRPGAQPAPRRRLYDYSNDDDE